MSWPCHANRRSKEWRCRRGREMAHEWAISGARRARSTFTRRRRGRSAAGGIVEWQLHDEPRTATWPSLHADGAAMGLDDLRGDEQADPEPGMRHRFCHALVWPEDPIARFLRNPPSLILDAQARHPVDLLDEDSDGTPQPVLGGVRDQIVHYLLQANPIPPAADLVEIERDRRAAALDLLARALQHAAHHLGQIDLLACELHPSGADAADVEELADQLPNPLRLGAHPVHGRGGVFQRERRTFAALVEQGRQQLGLQLQNGQRVAQLVRGDREEAVAGLDLPARRAVELLL